MLLKDEIFPNGQLFYPSVFEYSSHHQNFSPYSTKAVPPVYDDKSPSRHFRREWVRSQGAVKAVFVVEYGWLLIFRDLVYQASSS